MEEFKSKLPLKPKVGLYIDDSNLYKRGKATGWMTDYKKLYKWVAELNTIIHARIYKGRPRYEPAKSISEALENISLVLAIKLQQKI